MTIHYAANDLLSFAPGIIGLSRNASLVPVYRQLISDTLTPSALPRFKKGIGHSCSRAWSGANGLAAIVFSGPHHSALPRRLTAACESSKACSKVHEAHRQAPGSNLITPTRCGCSKSECGIPCAARSRTSRASLEEP